MSKVARIKALLPNATPRPWGYTGIKPEQAATVADFTDITDCELAAVSVNSMDALLALYEAAGAINARSVLGITYIRAAERKALSAALAKLGA